MRSNLTGKKGKGNMKIIFETKYLTLHESRLKKNQCSLREYERIKEKRRGRKKTERKTERQKDRKTERKRERKKRLIGRQTDSQRS